MASKRKSYSVLEKLEALNKLRNEYGSNKSLASRELGVGRKMLRDWLDAEPKLLALDFKDTRRRNIGAGRRPFAPELEAELSVWYDAQLADDYKPTYSQLCEEARRIYKRNDISRAMAFSDKWISSFLQRRESR